MADSQRRPILGNGEEYSRAVKKRPLGRGAEPPRTYEEARELVKVGVRHALASFETLPTEKKLVNEAVFCLRLHPDATAKSYDPVHIFEDVPDVRKVGSRRYRENPDRVAKTERIQKHQAKKTTEVEGRLVFVQSSPAGFQRLLRQLDRTEREVRQVTRDEIRRVERFDLLSPEEQILGFEAEWEEGRVELVLHPTRVSTDRQLSFVSELFKTTGVDLGGSNIKLYPDGPTFISCRLTRDSLQLLRGTNPLRTAHPLEFGGLTELRSAPVVGAPKPSASTTRSTIKIGMFDGGVDKTVPLLLGHVEEDASLEIKTATNPTYIAHGTAVAGALLHGPLNGIASNVHLPPPPVYVVSIRALPTSNPKDVDLYESIDIIEKAVPARNDIKVFNISFGPRGPIADDSLSRFTYVLDSLAANHKVAFFVPVGNDGGVANFNRIQSPSDLVNGIGVGAFTMSGDRPVHAPYSCQGLGRECGKIKPDVAAFGGCENRPFHLVSTTAGTKILEWGTSFASPLAARLGGQAAEIFERSSALLARALVIHTAIHPDGNPDHLLGHGCIMPDVTEVLLCEDKSVTIIFQGDILPTRILQIPIPLPNDVLIPGKVQVSWTVAALPRVSPNHAIDYTSACLEDTFYPNSKKFNFSLKGAIKSLHLNKDKAQITQLLSKGWKQASFPVSESGNKYRDGQGAKIDCLWEPTVRRSLSKYAKSLDEPFLTLHAMSRNSASDRFDYVAVVTVRAEKFQGDLYTKIRQRYPALAPIRVRTEAEIRVQI